MPLNTTRPNPDELLKHVQTSELKATKGNLTIFIGMAAGVGKTYAMLSSAKDLLLKNVDVVIGVVETHKRLETEKQANGIPKIPKKTILYKGLETTEMDLDAILKRNPDVVLVDELAHTNIHGSRHHKRYLDILELLENGIDVFTTVNIQHLESRATTVYDITGIKIKETVPDSFFDQATDIILIDLTPEALLKRLDEEKIYPKAQIETAKNNFFKLGNITALRDMALHLATERADKDARSYQQLHNIEKTWKSAHRLGVVVFPHKQSEAIIRWTRRLADNLNTDWIAIIPLPPHKFSENDTLKINQHLNLIEQLGGQSISIYDDDPILGIITCAKQHQVTQIIINKHNAYGFRDWIPGCSITDRLLRQCTDIDIYRVSNTVDTFWPLKFELNPLIPPSFKEWIIVTLITCFCFSLATLLSHFIGYIGIGFIFLLAVCISGLFLSRSMIMLLAILFTTIHNLFFIPPLFTFSIERPEDMMMLSLFLITAATMGHLTHRLKTKESVVQQQNEVTHQLFELTKILSTSTSISEIANKSIYYLESMLKTPIGILLKPNNIQDMELINSPEFNFPENEKAVAQWVFLNKKPAGKFTDTLSASESFYTPLISKDTVWGVLGITIQKKRTLSTENLALIKNSAYQIASALEREFAHEKAYTLEIFKETQKLYKALLDSVSHEFKTPLATLRGSTSLLLDNPDAINPIRHKVILSDITKACQRLQTVVDHLLDMTRIESGNIIPKTEPYLLSELIGHVQHSLKDALLHTPLTISIAPNAENIICDPVLTENILTNILGNAIRYTPQNTAIELTATTENTMCKLTIRDHGNGLPKQNPEIVFEKFYREHPEKSGGLGLGLSIAKRFSELQKGYLTAENQPQNGAIFTLYIPLKGNTK